MSIKDISEKIKSYWLYSCRPAISKIKENFDVKEDLFLVLIIILVGLGGFGLGKLSTLEKAREPVQMRNMNSNNINSTTTVKTGGIPNISAAAMVAGENAKGLLVASKNGTKYHFPWCGGAAQISEKNKIWFDSYEEAQKAGYTPASNCKGLK